MLCGIEFSKDPNNFKVTYNSPRRKISNLRDEFNIDALSISKDAGPVYIALSSGVDSQIIARCFLDQNLDAEFVFLHIKGYNDQEYAQILECEKFYNISVRKIDLHLEEHKEEWIRDNQRNEVNCISQYPFLFLSNQLENPWPIIVQGKSEPAIVGVSADKMAIYHNYYESMELRFSMMSRHRKIYDFPYSPESIASYYTDDNIKVFSSTIKYFANNNLKIGDNLVEYSQYFNMYVKPFVKGKYFKDDVIWFSKLTGAENYPSWLIGSPYPKHTRVSVPYWDLVKFLEENIGQSKTYNQWTFNR